MSYAYPIPLFAVFLSVFATCNSPNDESPPPDSGDPATVDVSFLTPDGIEIIGDWHETAPDATTLLLFHQGGSNARAEYGPIIPRLTAAGYSVLTIDQRVGGQWYGSYNRTLARITDHVYGDGYGYCDAYNNLEGALDYLIDSGVSGKKILWGSSYSASLAIQLAAKRPADVIGVLAFSPPGRGGPLDACAPEAYLDSLTVPLLLMRPIGEMESESAKAQIDLAEKNGHQTYVADPGVHGSSMLVSERVDGDVEATWTVVENFLSQLENQQKNHR